MTRPLLPTLSQWRGAGSPGPKNWEKGDWFVSFSGETFNVMAPRPEQIHLIDIAHHLAQICRFGGAVSTFYSVADHSVYVSREVPPELARKGLLHDAAEAYLGDVIKPLKNCLPEYERIEDIWEPIIAARFGLDSLKDPLVKRADIRAVHAERRDLLGATKAPGGPAEIWDAYNARLGCETPSERRCMMHGQPLTAERLFLERAAELGLRV